MDRDQRHQRAQWPIRAHRRLGRQPNDRLGRTGQQRLVEHRREILRDLPGTHANTHSHCYADSYGYVHGYTNSHSYSHPDAEPNSHTNSVTYGDGYCHAWRNGNCNANGDSAASITNPNGDGNTDAYANGHAETYTDAKAWTDAEAARDSATSPLASK